MNIDSFYFDPNSNDPLTNVTPAFDANRCNLRKSLPSTLDSLSKSTCNSSKPRGKEPEEAQSKTVSHYTVFNV